MVLELAVKAGCDYIVTYNKRDFRGVEQFNAIAIAEKLSALMTEKYLQERGQRGSREKYETALSQILDVEPEDFDKMPADS